MAQHNEARKARYTPHNGLAAIDPKAFGLEFLLAPPPMPAAVDGVAFVNVCGPLAFGGFLFDTYSAIRERVRAALASDAQTVVLCFDTPGGDVDGCFDCARGMRADAAAAKKTLLGWVPSKVCSAGYALATSCERLIVSASAQVGSIGVVRELQSVTKADAALGVEFAYVVSGSKKALGNPHLPITEATITEAQAHVDATALLFFALVKETRGVDAGALQAGVLMGDAAVRAGLADEISTLDELLAELRSTAPDAGTQIEGGIQASSASRALAAKDHMADEKKPDDKKDEDATRAALVKDSTSDDEMKAKRAAKALKAYDSEDGDDDKKDKGQKAEAPSDEKKDEKKDDDKALTAASSLAASMAAQQSEITALKASLAKRDEKDAAVERATLFAQYAHLPESLLKSLDGLSLEQCRKVLASVPPTFKSNVPELSRPPVLGAQTGADREAFLRSPLAERMGLTELQAVVETTPDRTIQTFGVLKPKAQVTK